MLKNTVSDFIIRRLSEWGIKRIFGYPGNGISGMVEALNRSQDAIQFIQARHEEMAAFMACAHAKFTGEVGICLATSGPGAIHLLNGLYDAKLDHQPVVAIIGQQARSSLGNDCQQEVDLLSLFKDVASAYIQIAVDESQIRHLIDRAVRIAQVERTVTCVIIPQDIQSLKLKELSFNQSTAPPGIGHVYPLIIPTDFDLKRAAEVLNAGKRVAILIGAGALHATDEIIQAADLLGAGVAKALLGKAALPDHLPFVTGSIGIIGTKPSQILMETCDTLFIVGSSFPYPAFLPKEGQARGVQIDIDGRMLSLRYPMEVNLIGDSKETLRLLIPHLIKKTDRAWRAYIEQEIIAWNKDCHDRARLPAKPLNPQLVFQELSARLPEECILTADAGSAAAWLARDVKVRRGMLVSLSGNLASMGSAVPYAIAAKFAFPKRIVIALVGDGAMQMNGNEELITIKKYWQEWLDPRLIILVLNNRDLNFETWEQRLGDGNPIYENSQSIPDFPYARYAESLGLKGLRVDSPNKIGDAFDIALQADCPILIEAVTDPDIPPFAPHIALMEKGYAFPPSLIPKHSGTEELLPYIAKIKAIQPESET
ncbi:thiamine pyrophosphate-requiring protein [Candidatus Protochlamydia phocaeensis]|uniref:thiamine pyrophosphate-requiring protein n=1 Tax=Candidatus Protochlamydia phocaeensis TaxID=1414722 RepID=UPI0008392AE9|nr:thiamine pyrophosphate-requiring protein [Candidatus Protochlamydia phocaeensis]